MRVVVAGLGVQGQKRRRVAGRDFIAAVDPINGELLARRALAWALGERGAEAQLA